MKYIHIIISPYLGLRVVRPGWEGEQGRFRVSSEGAGGDIERAWGSRGERRESRGSIEGARGEYLGAVQWRCKWEPEMERDSAYVFDETCDPRKRHFSW